MNTISRKSLISLASAAILMLPAAIAQATTRYVPSQYHTIQLAINAAHSGDTIVVAAGTYSGTLIWANKNLTIEGAGAGESIVSGLGANRCLETSGLTTASSISGFTFYGGSSYSMGSGMYNTGSSLIVTNCAFSSNSAPSGGGMFNDSHSNVTVTNCTFANNSATNGGGIVNQLSSSTITNCVFTGNFAANGGGIYNVNDASTTVTNCTFTNNCVSDLGGFYWPQGAGIYNDQNCQATVTNCTFNGNIANIGFGGAMYNMGTSSSLTVTNCILWGDFAGLGGPEICGGASISYSDLEDFTNTDSGPGANHNICANPLFENAANDNLNLQAGSPCIDRGINSVLASPPFYSINDTLLDLNFCRRLSGPNVDMGAYEFQSVTDVTSLFKIYPIQTTSGSNGSITQTVIIVNLSSYPILDGPETLVLNLLPGYTLSNRSGVTSALAPAGRPYINLSGFLPGGSMELTLQFTKTGTGEFLYYTTQVYDGIGKR